MKKLLLFIYFISSFYSFSQNNQEPLHISFNMREFIMKNLIEQTQQKEKVKAYFSIINKQQLSNKISEYYRPVDIEKFKTDGQLTEEGFKKLLVDFAIRVTRSNEFIEFNKDQAEEKLDTLTFDNKTFVTKSAGMPCDNTDFETGNFNNWDLSKGVVTNQPYGYGSVTNANPNEQHFITSGGFDPNVPNNILPKVNPDGGTYSAQLGDYDVNSKCAIMSQTFMVDQNSTAFSYSYAIVLQDPSAHTLGEKPFYKVNMYDENHNSLSCGEFSVISGNSGDPGFIQFEICDTTTLFPPFPPIITCEDAYYLPWRTTFIPLDAYVGQNVTLEFVTGDCSQDGHWGYAYLDASCSAVSIDQSAAALCSGDPVVLTAPEGAASYLWSPGGQTTQTITVTQPGTYSVTVTPVSGSGCSIVLETIITGSTDHPIADFTVQPTNICVGSTVTVTDQSTIVGTSSITDWKWDFDGDGVVDATEQNPAAHTYDTPGTYDLTLTVSANGCNDSKIITIQVDDGPDGSWTAPDSLCHDASPIDLNSLLTGQTGGVWSGTGVTGSTFNPSAGSQNVTYSIESSTCNVEVTHTIPVLEEIQIAFTLPDEICLEADPISLNAQPNGGTFTLNGQAITEFNPATYGLGNHTITYSISPVNYPSCVSSSSTTIKVVDGLTITSNIPDKFCYQAEDFTVIFTPSGGTMTGDLVNNNQLSIATAEAGNYSIHYEYVSPEGCHSDYDKTFTIQPEKMIDFNYEEGCFQNVTFTAEGGNYNVYQWTVDSNPLGTGKEITEQIKPAGQHNITLTAIDAVGCKAIASQTININESNDFSDITIPNVLTPNGDGKNDEITMPMMDEDCLEYKVLIMNRWGQTVYTCDKDNPTFSGKTQGGTDLGAGVYFYKLVSNDFDCSEDPYKPRCHGFITIVR